MPYVPAQKTLGLYLDNMRRDQQEAAQQSVKQANLRMLRRTTPVQWKKWKYIPLGIDTTVLNNSKSYKEGMSRTYKQVNSYHSIIIYTGRGKLHAQPRTAGG